MGRLIFGVVGFGLLRVGFFELGIGSWELGGGGLALLDRGAMVLGLVISGFFGGWVGSRMVRGVRSVRPLVEQGGSS